MVLLEELIAFVLLTTLEALSDLVDVNFVSSFPTVHQRITERRCFLAAGPRSTFFQPTDWLVALQQRRYCSTR